MTLSCISRMHPRQPRVDTRQDGTIRLPAEVGTIDEDEPLIARSPRLSPGEATPDATGAPDPGLAGTVVPREIGADRETVPGSPGSVPELAPTMPGGPGVGAGGRTIGAAVPDAAATRPPAAGHRRPVRPGVDGCRIVAEIGKGGMGVVYRVHQESLDRPIALKTVRPEHASPRLEKLFTAEALVTGYLDHPNILPVHDLRVDAAGTPYLTMKLLEGSSWQALLHPAGPGDPALTLADHLQILLKVCDAMAFAHSRGVIHRDLKPENIMVGSFGEVVVMDWGLAVECGDPGSGPGKTSHVTEVRTVAGTPAYMAPEMARVDRRSLGIASDVYLLGAILYEILTGSPPHRGDTVTEVLASAGEGAVEPPEERAPLRRIHREISRVAMRALSPDPARRNPSVLDFADAVRSYLAHSRAAARLDGASRSLEILDRPGEVSTGERYGVYTAALAEIRDALRSWPENEDGLQLQAAVATRFAEEALDRQEFGVVESQLALLCTHPHADPGRLADMEAALRTRVSARNRSLAAAAVLLLLVLLGIREYQDRSGALREARTHDRREEEFTRTCLGAWDALRTGNRLELAGAVPRLSEERFLEVKHRDERLAALALAGSLQLGRTGRWEEVFALTLDPVGADIPSIARELGRIPRLARVLPGDPRTLHGTRATRSFPGTDLWSAVTRCLRGSGDRAAVEQVLAILEAREEAAARVRPDAGAAPFREALRGFRRTALRRLADRASTGETDPDVLAVVPFGDPELRPDPGTRIRLDRGPDGTWIGREGAREVWRLRILGEGSWDGSPLRAGDGSLVIGSGDQLLRLDPLTGKVLARSWVEGAVLDFWPDPEDPRTLRVLTQMDFQLGLAHLVEYSRGRQKTASQQFHVHPFSRATSEEVAKVVEGLVEEIRHGSRGGAGSPLDLTAEARSALGNRLAGLWSSDPFNPDLALELIELGVEPDDRVRALFAPGAAMFDELSPQRTVDYACRLERAGRRDLADRLYDHAAGRFQELGGNANIAVMLTASPVMSLRRLGGQLFAAGDTTRALDLVEIGRRFSEFVEGDQAFYVRYRTWLKDQRGGRELLDIEGRIRDSVVSGGYLLISSETRLLVDACLYVFAMSPIIFVLLVARLTLRSRATRIRDLQRLGIRGRAARWSAFLARPLDRVRHVFLAYASRAERAAIAISCGTFILCAGIASTEIRAIGQLAALPAAVGGGLTTSPGFARFVHRRSAERPLDLAPAILHAESLFREGDLDGAAAVLRRAQASHPDDPLVQTNLAIIDEHAGRREDAHRELASVAAIPGRRGAVARWNLARLAGDPEARERALREMSHGDVLRAGHGDPDAPLYGSARAEHLLETVLSGDSLWQRSVHAVVVALEGGDGLLGPLDLLGPSAGSGSPTPWLRVTVQWVMIASGILGLIWIPLPVRPLDRKPRRDRSRPASPDRWGEARPFEGVPSSGGVRPGPPSGPLRRALVATAGIAERLLSYRRVAAGLLGVVVPGVWDLLWGHLVRGALTWLGILVAWSIRQTVLHGGVLSAMAIPALNQGYFPHMPASMGAPGVRLAGEAATWFLVLLFLVNVPLTLHRIRVDSGDGSLQPGP